MASIERITPSSRQSEITRESNSSRLSENHPEFKQDNGSQPLRQSSNSSGEIKILLIAGDSYHFGLLCGYCQLRGGIVSTAENIRDAKDRLAQPGCHTVIVDLKFLKKDVGRTLVDSLYQTKVQLFVIGEQWEFDQKNNVEYLGVDGCLTKPLDLEQLDLHLRAGNENHRVVVPDRRKSDRRAGFDRRNRKTNGITPTVQSDIEASDGCISAEIFQVNFLAKQVTKGLKNLDFTPKEFALFSLFLSHPGRVFSTEELIEIAWPARSDISKADLYQYIYNIRKKIEENPKHPRWLLTVRQFGYKFRKK